MQQHVSIERKWVTEVVRNGRLLTSLTFLPLDGMMERQEFSLCVLNCSVTVVGCGYRVAKSRLVIRRGRILITLT